MRPLGRRLWLVPLALFVIWSVHLIVVTPFPAPDELEHLSYAAHLQETGRFVPLFRSQTTLDRADFTRWDTRPNYIGHPSPYYLFISAVLVRTLPPAQAILLPRFASFLLLLLGVVLSVRAGLRWFADDIAAACVFVIGVTLCPEIFSAARQVTNDALAILGGALVYWGVAPAASRRRVRDLATVMGFALALWAKPNAGLGIGVFLGALVLLRYPGRWRLLALAVAGGVVGILPTIPIVLTYGAIVPVTAEAIWDVHHADGVVPYVPIFLFNLGYTWGYLKTGIWPIGGPGDLLLSLAFWTMLFVVAGMTWLGPRRPREPAAILARAAVAAFVLLMLIHFAFSAATLGGSIPAASYRYYLALLPASAHAAAYALSASATHVRRIGLAAILGAAMTMGWFA